MSRGLDIKGKEYTPCDERSSSRQKQQPKDHLVQPREAGEGTEGISSDAVGSEK